MPCYPCVLACDKGTIKIRVCFRSVVVPVVVGLGRNARACRDRPRVCPILTLDSFACVFIPSLSDGAANRHGVCPYMRAERPSWQGARINEILERDVPGHQTLFYHWNVTFQGIKTIFIAGTPRSKASNPFLLPERHVLRHQTPFLLPERDVPGHQTLFLSPERDVPES